MTVVRICVFCITVFWATEKGPQRSCSLRHFRLREHAQYDWHRSEEGCQQKGGPVARFRFIRDIGCHVGLQRHTATRLQNISLWKGTIQNICLQRQSRL